MALDHLGRDCIFSTDIIELFQYSIQYGVNQGWLRKFVSKLKYPIGIIVLTWLLYALRCKVHSVVIGCAVVHAFLHQLVIV